MLIETPPQYLTLLCRKALKPWRMKAGNADIRAKAALGKFQILRLLANVPISDRTGVPSDQGFKVG
jgi:hypothetical protein